jgi:hypothetical protein
MVRVEPEGGAAAMDQTDDLRRVQDQVREATHELSNALGIALNYTDFLGEDVAGADRDHPIWQRIAPIETALRRAADSVRVLREQVLSTDREQARGPPRSAECGPPRSAECGPPRSAEHQVGADGAQHRQQDRDQDHP